MYVRNGCVTICPPKPTNPTSHHLNTHTQTPIYTYNKKLRMRLAIVTIQYTQTDIFFSRTLNATIYAKKKIRSVQSVSAVQQLLVFLHRQYRIHTPLVRRLDISSSSSSQQKLQSADFLFFLFCYICIVLGPGQA